MRVQPEEIVPRGHGKGKGCRGQSGEAAVNQGLQGTADTMPRTHVALGPAQML